MIKTSLSSRALFLYQKVAQFFYHKNNIFPKKEATEAAPLVSRTQAPDYIE